MKKVLVPLCAVAALMLAGCGTVPTGTVAAPIMLDVKDSGPVYDASVRDTKVGRATVTGIILVSFGDGSIAAAMRDGGITKVNRVEYEYQTILYMYTKKTTVVYGE